MAEIKQPLLSLQPSERRKVVRTDEDSRILDDKYFLFGTRDDDPDYISYDNRLGYSSSDSRLDWTFYRETTTFPNRQLGLKFDFDNFFIGEGAKQHRGVVIDGTRPATAVMGGDAHDWLLSLEYTNRAINTPAGSYARGLNVSLSNRAAGEIDRLEAMFISARQRGDGDAITSMYGARIDVVHNVGGEAATGQEVGVAIEIQMEANGPAHADTTGNAGLRIDQHTDGVYTNLPDGVQLRNRGTSSCKGFQYGVNFYDSRADTCDIAEIRMMTADAGSLPCIIVSGTATSDATIVSEIGADTLYADGSLYVSVVDGAGKLFQKQNDTWVDMQA